VAKGWSADRSIGRQVKTLQATTKTGVPLYFRPQKSSANELPAFTAALDTLRAQLPAGLVVVADSGLGYLATRWRSHSRHPARTEFRYTAKTGPRAL
jgi:hypothetical protein